jgi:hypothetical protein
MNATEQLRRYREHGRIIAERDADSNAFTCAFDGIRLWPKVGGGWRHDLSQIDRLVKEARTFEWPGAGR